MKHIFASINGYELYTTDRRDDVELGYVYVISCDEEGLSYLSKISGWDTRKEVRSRSSSMTEWVASRLRFAAEQIGSEHFKFTPL